MKRFVLGVMVVLSGAAALPLGASASAPTPPATLRGYVCQTAKMQTQRAMSITAVMGHVDGTSKLQVRFQLVKRVKRHGPSTKVSGRGLNNWLTPPPPKPPAAVLGTQPRDTWIVKKPVVGLAAPAYYRFNVAFRWLDAQGQVIDTAFRHSRVCFQPEPDLKVANAWASNTQPGSYIAFIGNRGTAPSGFTVKITPANDPNDTLAQATEPSIDPGDQVMVSLTGTPCIAGEPLQAVVTPSVSTDDSDQSNNARPVPCPSTTATPARAHRGR